MRARDDCSLHPLRKIATALARPSTLVKSVAVSTVFASLRASADPFGLQIRVVQQGPLARLSAAELSQGEDLLRKLSVLSSFNGNYKVEQVRQARALQGFCIVIASFRIRVACFQ